MFKAAVRGQPIEGKISNAHYLHSYLMYLRLTTTVERNLLLIENLKENLAENNPAEGLKITKPQDLVRLFDIIIQVIMMNRRNNLKYMPNAYLKCVVLVCLMYATLYEKCNCFCFLMFWFLFVFFFYDENHLGLGCPLGVPFFVISKSYFETSKPYFKSFKKNSFLN